MRHILSTLMSSAVSQSSALSKTLGKSACASSLIRRSFRDPTAIKCGESVTTTNQFFFQQCISLDLRIVPLFKGIVHLKITHPHVIPICTTFLHENKRRMER